MMFTTENGTDWDENWRQEKRLIECVRREVQEEAGLVIQNPHLHGMLMVPNFKGNDWYVFVFTAIKFDRELLESSPEGRLEWIDDAKITSLNLWQSDHIFTPWTREGKFFSAKFEYKREAMQRNDVIFYNTDKSLQEHYGDQLGNGLDEL